MLARSMPGPWTRRIRSSSGLVALALLGPLLVPAALLPVRWLAAAARGEALPAAGWQLLAVVGPAIPLYLALLPLLPFGLRAQRRGWAPRAGPLLLWIAGLGSMLDLGFYLARR